MCGAAAGRGGRWNPAVCRAVDLLVPAACGDGGVWDMRGFIAGLGRPEAWLRPLFLWTVVACFLSIAFSLAYSFGKRVGDEVQVKIPDGVRHLKITEIR